MLKALSIIVSLLVLVLAAVAGWSWLEQFEENEIINILASREEELGLPVYAQFVVTQTLYLESAKNLQQIEIPMYWPDPTKEIDIELLVRGKRLRDWKYQPAEQGIGVAKLMMSPAELVSGSLEVRMSAGEILHAEKDMAPRLFVETDDGQYPEGNYRIAENEKQGDVSMRLVEIRQVKDRILLDLSRDPLKILPQIGYWVLALWLLITLPLVLARVMRGGSAH